MSEKLAAKKEKMARKMVGTMDDIRKDGPGVRRNNAHVNHKKLDYVVTSSGKGNVTKLVPKK